MALIGEMLRELKTELREKMEWTSLNQSWVGGTTEFGISVEVVVGKVS